MDTSETAKKVLGLEPAISADRITSEEWMEIIEFIYGQPLVSQVRELFPRIGDLIGGIPHHFFKAYIPSGLTHFPKGIGVNSHVHLSNLKWSFFHRKYLVLLKPDARRIPNPLRWAVWELTFSSQDGGTRTVGESSVLQFLQREDVIQLFAAHPDVRRSFVDISKAASDYAEELANRSRALVELAQRLREVRERISF